MSVRPDPDDGGARIHAVRGAERGSGLDPFALSEVTSGGPGGLVGALRTVREYAWSIVLITAAAVLIGALGSMSSTPIYRADARLLVKIDQSNLAMAPAPDTYPLHWLFYETQYDIIRSRAVAAKAVDRVGIDRLAPPREDTPAVGARLRGWWRGLAGEPGPAGPAAGAAPEVERRRGDVIDGLRAALQVHGGEESEVIELRYESPDPELAAAVVNAVADAYVEFGLESRIASTSRANRWLVDRVEELKQKVDASEAALRDYQTRSGMVDSESRETMIGVRLGSLSSELIKAQARRSETAARLRQAQQARTAHRGAAAGTQPLLIDNPLVVDAHRDHARLGRRVNELSERYGRKHPKMIAARAELADAATRLQQEVDKAYRGVQREHEVARAQEAELRRMIGAQQAEMRAVSGRASELARREREVVANRELYDAFLARHKEVDVAARYDVTNVRMIDSAEVPRSAVWPNHALIIGLAAALGLFAALSLAYTRAYLDKTIRVSEDVEQHLNLPVIGVVPRVDSPPWRRVELERYALTNPQSSFAESVNDVRTAILFSGIDEPVRSVLLTSASAGEGKTVLASNLAIAFAARGKTLLLECDLRRGRLTQAAGLEGGPGLTDVITGECGLRDAIQADPEVRGLHYLPAGTVPPNPLEVLSSRRFALAYESLLDSFEYVVVDAPPLLPISDSIVLSRLCDTVVLCLQTDRISFDTGRDALKRMAAARRRPVGVVLQQVDLKRMRRYSGRYQDHYASYYSYRGA